MERGDYSIRNFYQGGTSSFSPSYGDVFIGYHVAAGQVGANTKPDTANQIQQVNQLLNQGIVPVEVTVLPQEAFDQVPKQHFKEIGRKAKLAGAKVSLHAPIVEPSGIGEQGWSESNRQLAERQLQDDIARAMDMDDKGGMPVTIHSAGIPGSEYQKTKEGKKLQKLIVINQETGKMAPLEEEKKFYPDRKELKPDITQQQIEQVRKGEKPEETLYTQTPLKQGRTLNPMQELKNLNATEWDNNLSQIIYYKEGADRILNENALQIAHLQKDREAGRLDWEDLTPEQNQAMGHIENAKTYLENSRQYLSGLFHKAYKFGSEDDKELLTKASEEFTKDLQDNKSVQGQSQAIQRLIMNLKRVEPQLYVPIENFALEKSSETFANVAFKAFEKYKGKAPTISIENLYPGMAFSMKKEGEKGLPGMKELILETKKKFVDKAMEKGHSRSAAEEQADKMIGMTLDVGHLNIAKKHGFEDKDLRKEVEEIAKYVKHVHLTDNFGYGDSHLPPGMGNVPFKEILEELEKQGVTDVNKIVEAGGFVQHFGQSPYPVSLQGLGSPVYPSGNLYWNQISGLQQGYFSGYGQMLPAGNYETFGSGFSQLPAELGGQRGGGQGSRMGGAPME